MAIEEIPGLPPRRIRRGEAVYRQGEPAVCLYVIESGSVKMTALSSNGKESVTALCGPGEIIGEQALFDPVRDTDARAAERSVLRPVPVAEARRRLRTDPTAAISMLGEVAGRLRRTAGVLHAMMVLDAPTRVARRLCDLAEAHGVLHDDGVRIRPPLTQEDLASMTGCSRETVNKTLAEFARHGWVRTAGASYVITDEEALRERAAT